jgi:hypothetical protein
MDKSNLISEGFSKVLLGLIAGAHLVKFFQFLKKKNISRKYISSIKGDIKQLNNLRRDMERDYEKEFGKKIDMTDLELKDFNL